MSWRVHRPMNTACLLIVILTGFVAVAAFLRAVALAWMRDLRDDVAEFERDLADDDSDLYWK